MGRVHLRVGLINAPNEYEWSSFKGKVREREDKLIDYDDWYNSLGDTIRER